MNEVWMEMDDYGYEYYQVSNTGKVRSVDRAIISKAGQLQPFMGKELVLRNNKKCPHLFFEVTKMVGDKQQRRTFYIHKIVAEMFLPKPSSKQIYVTHINWNFSDNCANNLLWITHKQLMNRQPLRRKDPSKAWRTRRLKYGKSGTAKYSLIKTP